MRTFRRIYGVAVLAVLAGCAGSPPIQPAASSKSTFDGAVYKGTTVKLADVSPGNVAYRVDAKGGSGFVSMQSVREDAEQRAKDFCDRKGGAFESLTETTTTPPYIFGNFPRIEIVFQCVQHASAQPAPSDPKYAKLVDLRKLQDSGVITQAEFDREKAKILAQP